MRAVAARDGLRTRKEAGGDVQGMRPSDGGTWKGCTRRLQFCRWQERGQHQVSCAGRFVSSGWRGWVVEDGMQMEGCDYILPCEGIEGTLSGFPSIDNLSGLQVPRAPHTVIAGKWIRIGLEMGYNWGQTLDKIAKF